MVKKGGLCPDHSKNRNLDSLGHFKNAKIMFILYKIVLASHHFELSRFQMVGTIAIDIAWL